MSGIIRKWDPEGLKRKIEAQVINGMEAACQFCADEARARVPVRSGATRDDIDYEVIASGDEVVGYIGLRRKGKSFWGRWVELGTSKMAARPFLRPAVFGNADTIVKLITGGGK